MVAAALILMLPAALLVLLIGLAVVLVAVVSERGDRPAVVGLCIIGLAFLMFTAGLVMLILVGTGAIQ